MNKKLIAVALSAACIATYAASDANDQRAKLLAKLAGADLTIKSSVDVPKTNLTMVKLDSGMVVYFDRDNKYVIVPGSKGSQVITLDDGSFINQTTLLSIEENKQLLKDLPPLPEFKAEKEKHVVTVFFDPQCGYCRLLYGQNEEYNKLGITIKYAAMAIFGEESENALASVWSNPNNPQASLLDKIHGLSTKKLPLTESLVGTPPSAEGRETVSEMTKLARQLGFSGTPGIALENGQTISGYLSPDELLKRLDVDLLPPLK